MLPTDEGENKVQKVTAWQKFKSYIWDSDAHLKTPFERNLLRKLDFGILIVACLGFFMRYLDSANLANAYVSGMKEDLNIFGNEYTYMGTCYTIAYALFQIPSTMVVTRVRPSLYLFLNEVGWGIFTFAQAAAQTSNQMYAFRFCVGMFEASFFPSILYLMGSWYNKYELAKRIAIFHLCGSLGSSFGGYLQAAVYETLDGHHGIAGWRWLFIVCGCMTVPCGLAVLLVLPDLPSNTRAWYLTTEEKAFALERAKSLGKSQPGEKKLDWSLIKRALSSWRYFAFVLGYIVYGTSCQATGYFGIWMKSVGYSVTERNVIPSCANLISAFCIFCWGFGSDLTGSRFAFVFGPLFYGLLPNGILAFWPESKHLKLFAFMTGGVQLMTAVFYTWANEILADDNELRALTISSMNGLQYSVSAWLPIVIFPQTQAPTFRRGFPATFGFVIAGLIIIVVIKMLADRDARRAAARQSQYDVKKDSESADDKAIEDTEVEGSEEDIAEIPVLGNATSTSSRKQ
ncbi:pantothenate transporter liz1 [Dendrothele bispora CBS 962.96]|uniref:Pantothenate transporter liz1 n=1 Tax=Dendrothele bispora (strain CBS 962.96) TaxID=1314807 RepID=A0A4S8MUH4_DENBC|nr:pantothenate transporter liz1 [Dendrothele bispora CBS 962.96]